jgi:iron(III) transport system substrate-binding protein
MRHREEEFNMFKNCKFLVIILGVCFLIGTLNVAEGKKLPADVEKWLKKNKIGPYQEEKVDYDALYRAAKKEGKVVVYAHTSRGPKSLALGFYDKYPGIKVEWNTIGVAGTISRTIKEQSAGVHAVDVITAGAFPTQLNVMHPANMIFPWVPPDLKKVLPQQYQKPLLIQRLILVTLFYNLHAWPDKPPIDSWWDVTRPEWKGRLVLTDPRTFPSSFDLFATIVLHGEEMAKEYTRVFGKPLKLTTPNAGYEWIKMVLANEPKLVRDPKDAKYIGESGQAKPALGIGWNSSRITDSGNPKYGNIQYTWPINLKPVVGMMYPTPLSIAYKAPHPNGAKLLIRWLMGDEKGGAGIAPWFTPGSWPVRTDIKKAAPHPFNPKLSWRLKDINFWFQDAKGAWKEKKKLLNFFNKHL